MSMSNKLENMVVKGLVAATNSVKAVKNFVKNVATKYKKVTTVENETESSEENK